MLGFVVFTLVWLNTYGTSVRYDLQHGWPMAYLRRTAPNRFIAACGTSSPVPRGMTLSQHRAFFAAKLASDLESCWPVDFKPGSSIAVGALVFDIATALFLLESARRGLKTFTSLQFSLLTFLVVCYSIPPVLGLLLRHWQTQDWAWLTVATIAAMISVVVASRAVVRCCRWGYDFVTRR